MQFKFPDDFPLRGRYKRIKDRLYFHNDFKHGEIISFVCTTGKPSSTTAGYAWYQNEDRYTPTQHLINVSEIEKE